MWLTPRRLSSTTTTTTTSTPDISDRARRIRRQEILYRQLRRLVVPGFVFYGLFVLRPHEGHFVRYLAERRHHEADFNRLFPPLPSSSYSNSTSTSTSTSSNTTNTSTSGVEKEEKKGWWSWWRGNNNNNNNNNNNKSRSNNGIEETDEERLARKRLLFARERSYSAEDGTEMFRAIDAAQRATDLALQREHPPMHVLSEELLDLMEKSKAYEANKGILTDTNSALSTVSSSTSSSSSSCMPVRLEFHDWLFFATGAVVFSDRSGSTVKRLRFVGFCGMVWKEL